MVPNDYLHLLNVSLVRRILSITHDEMWELVIENLDWIRGMKRHHSGFFYALPHGMEHFRKIFLRYIAEDRELLVQSLIYDMCFIGPKLKVTSFQLSGFLDSPRSCGVLTSDELIWRNDPGTEAAHVALYFHLLDSNHHGELIAYLEAWPHKPPDNNSYVIFELKKMKQYLLENPGSSTALVYDVKQR